MRFTAWSVMALQQRQRHRNGPQKGPRRGLDLLPELVARLRVQAKPRQVLKGIFEALKPGGTFLCVDVAADSTHAGNMEHPMGPMMYTISTMHCMTVSLALGGEGRPGGIGDAEVLSLEKRADQCGPGGRRNHAPILMRGDFRSGSPTAPPNAATLSMGAATDLRMRSSAYPIRHNGRCEQRVSTSVDKRSGRQSCQPCADTIAFACPQGPRENEE